MRNKYSQVLKNKLQNIKSTIDIIQKHDEKRKHTLEKFQQIEKNEQKRLNKDHKQMLEKMQRTEELRKQKELENYERLKKQEEDYKKKREMIVNLHAEKEKQERKDAYLLLDSITDKMNSSLMKEQMTIQTTAEKARKMNQNASEKFENFKKTSVEDQNNRFKNLKSKDEKHQRRLERMYKSCTSLQEEIKQGNQKKIQNTSNNKIVVEKDNNKRNKDLIENKDK